MCISFEDILVCKKKKIQIHHVISLWRRDLKTEQKFSVRHLHFFSFKISSFLSFQLKFFIGIEGLRGGSAGKSTLSPSQLTLALSLSHTWERERERAHSHTLSSDLHRDGTAGVCPHSSTQIQNKGTDVKLCLALYLHLFTAYGIGFREVSFFQVDHGFSPYPPSSPSPPVFPPHHIHTTLFMYLFYKEQRGSLKEGTCES